MTQVRRLVYVSGAPGTGKTSLAGPLAAELGYALVTKDTIKETLHDALGAPDPDLAWSRCGASGAARDGAGWRLRGTARRRVARRFLLLSGLMDGLPERRNASCCYLGSSGEDFDFYRVLVHFCHNFARLVPPESGRSLREGVDQAAWTA
jgi:hypothetical protein